MAGEGRLALDYGTRRDAKRTDVANRKPEIAQPVDSDQGCDKSHTSMKLKPLICFYIDT